MGIWVKISEEQIIVLYIASLTGFFFNYKNFKDALMEMGNYSAATLIQQD